MFWLKSISPSLTIPASAVKRPVMSAVPPTVKLLVDSKVPSTYKSSESSNLSSVSFQVKYSASAFPKYKETSPPLLSLSRKKVSLDVPSRAPRSSPVVILE